jgi:hypothetical protein
MSKIDTTLNIVKKVNKLYNKTTKYKCTFQPLSGFTCEDAYVNPNRKHIGNIYNNLKDCQIVCDTYNDTVDFCTSNFDKLCSNAKGKGYKSCIDCVRDNRNILLSRESCTTGLYASLCALPNNRQICGEKFNTEDCPTDRPK